MIYQLANRDPKQLKRDIRGVVLCVTAFIITMNVVASFVMVFGALFENPEIFQSYTLNMSDAEYDAWVLSISEALIESSMNYAGLGSLVGMLCGLPWFFIIRGKDFLTKDVTKTNSRIDIGTLLLLFVFVLGVQGFMSSIQLGFDLLFFQGGEESVTSTLDEATTSLATSFWGVLYIVFIGPICEELVFRGAVMRKLEKYGANFAIIISSLLFGLYHMILFQAAFAVIIGLILAYTAGRFSIKWAMVLHMANNGLAVLSIVCGEVFSAVVVVCFFLALAATIIVLIVRRNMLVMQKQAGAPSEARVYARAFSSPWLILYMIGTVGMGVIVALGMS